MNSNTQSNLGLALIASLTLGLAPFFPEPHIWGKIKWIAGGAHGMAAMDWFDFFMHAAPFAWLGFEIWKYIQNKNLAKNNS